LIRLTNTYRDYFLSSRFLELYSRDTALRHHEQHRQILEAVRQRQGDRAERLVAEHFQSALAVIRAAASATEATVPNNKART
jgi:DNA-binding GntR family transcriptional regulator